MHVPSLLKLSIAVSVVSGRLALCSPLSANDLVSRQVEVCPAGTTGPVCCSDGGGNANNTPANRSQCNAISEVNVGVPVGCGSTAQCCTSFDASSGTATGCTNAQGVV